MQHDTLLSHSQKENYQRDGFLIITDFIADDICDSLIHRATELIHQFEPESVKHIFSSKNQNCMRNQYFFDSANKINFFFEEGAINAEGRLTKEKLFAINKIGHALHDLDPMFNFFSRSPKIAKLVNDLEVQDPLILQSMYICKQPYIGGEVKCHQDSTYIYIKDKPVIGLWFALQDATIENGCLWGIPGGHLTPLKSRFLREKNNDVRMEIYDNTPWNTEDMIPLEVKRGSVIILHGLLPHMSKENTSSSSRHAYSLHIISGQYEYPENNWLQISSKNPPRGFL